MGLLSWLIVGLIAGWLANQMMRGGRGNAVTDIVVGIVGALVGGFLAGELFGVPNAVSNLFRFTTYKLTGQSDRIQVRIMPEQQKGRPQSVRAADVMTTPPVTVPERSS